MEAGAPRQQTARRVRDRSPSASPRPPPPAGARACAYLLRRSRAEVCEIQVRQRVDSWPSAICEVPPRSLQRFARDHRRGDRARRPAPKRDRSAPTVGLLRGRARARGAEWRRCGRRSRRGFDDDATPHRSRCRAVLAPHLQCGCAAHPQHGRGLADGVSYLYAYTHRIHPSPPAPL